MRKRTPQEKKKLSYGRDRRNVYGEAPHAARKAIPLQKALRNRANRRFVNEQLALTGQISEEIAEEAESHLQNKRLKNWKKCPDAPLGEVVARKLQERTIMRKNGGRRALITRTTTKTEENS